MKDIHKHYRQLLGMARNWALQQLPGWSDESHRDLLASYGATAQDGRVSALTMSEVQMNAALDDYAHRGWPRRERLFQQGRVVRHVPPAIAKIVRLWALLCESGRVRDGSRQALLSWCARQTGTPVRRLDDLEDAQLQQLTEQLKRWHSRPEGER